MSTFTDRQLRDIVMLRGLNRTYGEIADYLGTEYGLDVSDSTVGGTVRDLESASRSDGPHAVFNEAVIKGYIDDLL